MSDSSDKYRYFDFLIYPQDHEGVDIFKVLRDTHMPFAVSPLHQPDEKDSEPHYHVIYKHGNPVQLKTAWRFLEPIKFLAVHGYIEPTYSPHGYMRYLIHLDDPEKEQFIGGRESITCINAFPLDLTRDLTVEDSRQLRRQAFEIIRHFDINEYSTLIEEVMADDELFDYVCNHVMLFKNYLDSKRHRDMDDDRDY